MSVTLQGVSVGGVWLDSEIRNVARKNTTHARLSARTYAHTYTNAHMFMAKCITFRLSESK